MVALSRQRAIRWFLIPCFAARILSGARVPDDGVTRVANAMVGALEAQGHENLAEMSEDEFVAVIALSIAAVAESMGASFINEGRNVAAWKWYFDRTQAVVDEVLTSVPGFGNPEVLAAHRRVLYREHVASCGQ